MEYEVEVDHRGLGRGCAERLSSTNIDQNGGYFTGFI